MCRKLHLSFWTPTDISDPSLEDLSKRGELRETDNPFADIARITYYECQTAPGASPTAPQYSRAPLCPGTGNTASTRAGAIRAFCAGDNYCAIRITNFAKTFDARRREFEDARAGRPRVCSQQEVWEVFQKAERALENWRAVWDAHGGCPGRRCGDGVVCRLVTLGVMERPVELWPDRRLGENPFTVVLR